eukprot:NODE_553_length_1484_cov_239.049685.p1 GENE.NODE_553_length_1484_cov_239.049685~~NODE_553_length_1484_cov_239.049685.p1  ORF type:complete len:375 (-),score=133.14 NODE_553_length_1484_cov_239.049685:359-1387(-)
MIAMLNTSYLRKKSGRNMTNYYLILSNLLRMDVGVLLKAHICRTFMEQDHQQEPDEELNATMVPAIMEFVRNSGTFLATYGVAALVHLSNKNTTVKNLLMQNGIAQMSVDQVQTKDDDLIYYTLMLMVNLTKLPRNRRVLSDKGLLLAVYDILTSSYHQCGAPKKDSKVNVMPANPQKEKILTQVCIVLGQFANDDETRQAFLDTYTHATKCLLSIFHNSTPAGALASKAIFALKQIIASSAEQKVFTCGFMAGRLLEDLGNPALERSPEFIYQSILLLQMFATLPACCEKMDSCKVFTVIGTDALAMHPNISKVDDGQVRLKTLAEDIENQLYRQRGYHST